MTEIQPFTFPLTGENVRLLVVDENPWFVLPDLCAVLGHSNPSMALAMVDEDDRWTLRRSDTLSFAYPIDDLRVQSINLVNESGLYSLILRSNVAGAREFKRWVTHEVLPAIRKSGSYSVADLSRRQLAQMVIDAENALEEASSRAAVAEHQVLELAPAAHAWDTLAEAKGDFDATQSAQILSRDPSISTGQRRLLEYMDSIRWTYKRPGQPRRPYQTQVDLGRLRALPKSYEHPHTGVLILGAAQVRITVKGLLELHRLLGGTQPLQVDEAAA